MNVVAARRENQPALCPKETIAKYEGPSAVKGIARELRYFVISKRSRGQGDKKKGKEKNTWSKEEAKQQR